MSGAMRIYSEAVKAGKSHAEACKTIMEIGIARGRAEILQPEIKWTTESALAEYVVTSVLSNLRPGI